jgi:thiosulfate/3-mercaptopyruvate sulfurtransferase
MTSSMVTSSWLEEHLEDPKVFVVEVTSSPEDTEYKKAHIPGAVWRFWKALCWHDTDRQFPEPDEMARRLGAMGVPDDATIVLYGDPVQFGTYPFWALTMGGARNLRLLDGGRTGWLKEGRPVSIEIPSYPATQYTSGKGDSSMRMGRDEVRDGLGKAGQLLLDVRSPEEYNGERVMPPPNFDHGAERKGRIPGAKSFYYRNVVNEDDTYKSEAELRALFESAGVGEAKEIISYCRLSHRATLVWFAMQHILGIEGTRIYDGSWTEWGSIVGFPIEK